MTQIILLGHLEILLSYPLFLKDNMTLNLKHNKTLCSFSNNEKRNKTITLLRRGKKKEEEENKIEFKTKSLGQSKH